MSLGVSPASSWWDGRRVLVTGHRGFIGSALVRRLLGARAKVWGVSRTADSADRGFPVAICDLSAIDACRQLIGQAEPERILHLAGHPFGARDLERIMPTFHDNLAATVNVLTAAAEAGVGRVVVTGSLEEPDPGEDALPSSPYAASKWAASVYARLFHRLYALPVVIARVFMVYGPGQRDPTKLIPSVIRACLQREPARIGSGERLVDWVYVEDVVTGLISAAEVPGLEGRTLELGTGVLTTVRQVVEQITALVPGAPAPEFGSLPARPFEQVRTARVEDTRRALGWAPGVPLSEGLRATLDWFREQAALAGGSSGSSQARAAGGR